MKHPWLIELEAYSGGTNIEQILTRALRDKDVLMEIGWYGLSMTLPKFGDEAADRVAGLAYLHGWDYNEDTKQLRTMFQQMVNPLPEKDLEEYM